MVYIIFRGLDGDASRIDLSQGGGTFFRVYADEVLNPGPQGPE